MVANPSHNLNGSQPHEIVETTDAHRELPVHSCSQSAAPRVLDYGQIEAELESYEATERQRLGLPPKQTCHWHDPNPQKFTRAQRDTTTILIGGLTVAQDRLIRAAWNGLGYRVESLPCPDKAALHFGKEYGSRGQCNPTWFTVGNLIKYLVHLRDEQHIPVEEIVERYLFLNAGACGPCRFGMYPTEYRKALRDAGFPGFRVLLFQQNSVNQTDGGEPGLQLNMRFFHEMVKGMLVGDVLNMIGYRIRPYERQPGRTDQVLGHCQNILEGALARRQSVVRALRRCRKLLADIEVDRLQVKPKVIVLGEFWAMTTEGDGNYHLQRFLEAEGAEVDIQPLASWLLYLIWQWRFDTLRRLELRGEDVGRKGLAGKHGNRRLWKLWIAERMVRGMFRSYARAIGLIRCGLPDMDELARQAQDFYDLEVRGGDGHMEVGKLIEAVTRNKAHMVVSVKPFGCMPSSGVSDGVQSAVLGKHPQAIFCPVETTGDGEVNFQSRILMSLFKARRKAREEFQSVLADSRLDSGDVRQLLTRKQKRATYYPRHEFAGTATNMVNHATHNFLLKASHP